MLNLQQRIHILGILHKYILSNDPLWIQIKSTATENNAWFIPAFINNAIENIASQFLEPDRLHSWAASYHTPTHRAAPVDVGITMAGNIPLAGFHDFLCVFVSGHKQTVRCSSKDQILLKHFAEKMVEWDEAVAKHIRFAEILKGCDAYIATGSNNTARYFEYYFRKYPHIIRKNRTSVAILNGEEQKNEFEKLADDVYLYFGLGCRNTTKLFVPAGFDFLPMLDAFTKYDWVMENHKYKHNYDYQLAVQIMNQKFYMTNGSIILLEDESVFSPISQLHYQYYTHTEEIYTQLNPADIQCISGAENLALGTAQSPSLTDYPDGIDTMNFLNQLGE